VYFGVPPADGLTDTPFDDATRIISPFESAKAGPERMIQKTK